MKQTLKEAAIDFADYELKNLDKLSFAVSAKADYDNGLTRGFKAGAEWQSKQSLWISVEERLPEDDSDYIVLLSNGIIGVGIYNNKDNVWIINGIGIVRNVFLWMPIPSFDEILEANRDVLQRLK